MNMKGWLLAILMFVSFVSVSQPGGPGGGGDPDVPITGIEYLLGLGALFGARRILKSFSKKP
jgi:hypothetical protein